MIRYITTDTLPLLKRFVSPADPFACRIACLLDSYSTGYDFASFWLQTDSQEHPTAAVGSYYHDMTVFLTENSDCEELTEFFSIRGFASLLSSRPLSLNMSWESGVLMRQIRSVPADAPLPGITVEDAPDLKEVWTLLKSCEEEDFSVPAYEDFLPDISHKLRHHTAVCTGIRLENRLLASATTVAQSDSCAVIGAVAAHRDFRHRGIGSFCVASLCGKLSGKVLYLMRASHKNEGFYQGLGFKNTGTFFVCRHP